MSQDAQYDLVVTFTDDSQSFTNGFEAGQLWEAMKRCEPTIEKTVHTANKDTIHRMAHAEGYDVDWTSSDLPEWSYLILTKSRKANIGGDLVSKGVLSVIEGGGADA